jgi:hypothetical protein
MQGKSDALHDHGQERGQHHGDHGVDGSSLTSRARMPSIVA